MSHRFPSISSHDATAALGELDAEVKIALGEHSSSFEYKDEKGAPIGPFAVFA